MADLKKALAEEKEYLVSIRREFHRHPEVSLKEFRTAKRIEEELEQFGIPHTRVEADEMVHRLPEKAGPRNSAHADIAGQHFAEFQPESDELAWAVWQIEICGGE